MCACTSACMSLWLQFHVCVCMCAYVCLYVCLYVCICMYVFVCMCAFMGAVHKVRHAIFGQFLAPLPLSHFVTHPGTPQKYVTHLEPSPDFLVGLVQKNPDKSPLYKFSQLFARLCPGGFVWWSLVWKVLSGTVFVHVSFCHNTSVTTES